MHLSFLAPLYRHPGPFATVYLDTSRNREEAPTRIGLRWREARSELSEAGCDAETLAALDAEVADDRGVPGSHGRVVVAAEGEVGFADVLPDPPSLPEAAYEPLPDLLPYLAARSEPVPHLLVTVDRVGGDIRAVTADGTTRSVTVNGETLHLRKVPDGDWAQARFQRRAENRWARNAAEVARVVHEESHRVGADIVVLAGDVRARSEVIDALAPEDRQRVVQTAAGGRADGTDPDALSTEVQRVLDEVAAHRVVEVADRWRTENAADRGVAGWAATVEALREGRADTVLLNPDEPEEEPLWIGPAPVDVATGPEELAVAGVEPVKARAGAAILRAAVGADADVLVVPRGELPLSAGMGAILRW